MTAVATKNASAILIEADPPLTQKAQPAPKASEHHLRLDLAAETIERGPVTPRNFELPGYATRPLRGATPVPPVAEDSPEKSHTLLNFIETVKRLGGKLEPYTAPTLRQRMFVFGESLFEIGHHLCHPTKIGGRLKILAASLTENPSITREVEQRKNIDATMRYLQSTMGRSYFLGLSLAVSSAALMGGAVASATHSPNLGILIATIIDYGVQTGAFIAMFMDRHKDYYFDKRNPGETEKRRDHFYKILTSDFGVSACIYGATFAATSALAHLSPAFSGIAAPAAAVVNFALFATVALGNVMVSAKFMTPSYEQYLEKRFEAERRSAAAALKVGAGAAADPQLTSPAAAPSLIP